jgi:hypothetical protein
VINDLFAICQLNRDLAIPDWAWRGSFCSATKTATELSIVCPQSQLPAEVTASRGWSCLIVEGPLDLSMTGVLHSLAEPLARARISAFAASTYETDYLLVEQKNLERALKTLADSGHEILRDRDHT